ncbi:tetratricopeptide repeat-containing sensor histidine kinase [Winogradskyella sp. SYSU M77433]|uniref:tetratricopeptide repeat-containing sensor histidine kinase n=1 Tax=Winogradskyella sp. SYSU M77433 TaxID=3042722 RepID=UPI0024811410|nr:tetratricopeptide repeat-containing sensor histidine kinase [Winogradskyella sp. SYSU M77433]MDH7912069.1 tetratricopeptide repeat protein [Winogradskyella sp. SYSU M77433]
MKNLLFVFFVFLFANLNGQSIKGLYDSVSYYRDLFSNKSLSSDRRLDYAKRANDLAIKIKDDSISLATSRDLAYSYLINGDFETFKNVSLVNLELANKLEDSSAIAFTNKNLGWYYYQIEDDNISAYPHFLKALQYFDDLKIIKEKAEILYSIAVIQDNEKDYLGSEQNAVEALRIFNRIYENENTLDKYLVLNLLGSVSNQLENFDKSIEYHKEALKISKELKDDYSRYLGSMNNLALPYRGKGDYSTALKIYDELLNEPRLKKNDIVLYSLIVDNNAFTKFLQGNYDFESLEKDFKKALNISDSIQDPYIKLASSIDLAKFYKENNKIDSSLKYAKTSYKISKEIPINDLYLESMLLLADLTSGEESNTYLEEHIKLSDSLLKKERNVRNKFARIEFETDQLEAENEQISKENLYLLILSIGLLLTAILVYIVISQRAKNRKLKLIQVQQKANEDIYNLMLGQQDKVDEARAKEKIRVSKELHDGVLGRLFGTRLSLDSINFKDGKEAMMTRANYISQLKTIEDDIRKISHELNTDFVSGSGFMDIVTELVENQAQAYSLEQEFNYCDDINWDVVPNKTKINIYRIIQESMQNIYKHANAKSIKISISLENDVICLDIIDDGEGFDASKNKKGIGLKNMTSRAEDINGNITFNSQSGNGTIVNVKIPYTNQST